MKSRYGPGGEFDPDWSVVRFSSPLAVAYKHYRKPPMVSGAPPPPPPPPEVPPPPEDMPPARPAWRTVTQRGRRIRKRPDAPPVEPPPEPRQAHSWVTWQRKFGHVWGSYSELLIDILLQLIHSWLLPRHPLNPLCLSPTAEALACSALVRLVIHTVVKTW